MTRRFVTHPSTWGVPFVVIVVLGAVLPAIYLSATVDPQKHLDQFPIAIVTAPQSVKTADSPADALATAIEGSVDARSFDVRVLSSGEAERQMDEGRLYGAIRVPADFDAQIGSLLGSIGSDATDSSASNQELARPVVEMQANPRIGGVTTSLFSGNLMPVLRGAQKATGERLVQLVDARGGSVDAAQRLLLAEPFDISAVPYRPLPAGTGLGTSAFYYALLLVLLGFLGASTIHPTVDSAMGFTPNEVGPLVSRAPYLALSRVMTLLAKFAVMLAAAPFASALVMLVAGPLLGMPIDHPVSLWLFSTSAMAAVGLSALTVFAVFGGIGAIVNMLFFVALAMTSSGGTVPLQATPTFFQWISTFEPMHAIVEGTKSILYFGATSGSGLTDAWIRVGVGGTIGVLVGLALTKRFDRSPRLVRHPVS